MSNFKKVSIQTILLVTIALLFVVSLQGISAADHSIDNTTTGGIRNAIVTNASVASGDTVYLQPGTYSGNNNTNMTINKNLTFKGNGSRDSVIIDAKGLSRIFTIGTGYSVTFINITFINGFGNGAAIYNYGPNFKVINCTFINNSGGSLPAIANTGRDMSVSGCKFINNSAISGGAIYNNAPNVNISNCTFFNNSGNGGAIHNTNTGAYNVTMSGCSFINNTGPNGPGAIYNSGFNVTISDCDFINNTGNNTGAILNVGNPTLPYGHNMTISGCSFINNTGKGNGGAIANAANAIMLVSGNVMNGNSANLGQMIYNNGFMGILNLTFIDNSTWIVKNGSTITLYVTLTDDIGNTVTQQNISFYLNGVFFENVTVIEGYANISYTPSSAGDIPVSGEYVGIGTYDILINNGLLKVIIPTNITITVPEEVKVGDTVILESILTDEDGNPIADATVDFYVDGVKVGSGVTDSNGIAKLNYTFTKAGKLNVVAKYDGNDTYLPSNATNTTTVSKIPTNITVSVPEEVKVGDTVILESILTDEDGNPIADATVDFYVDGVKVGSGITDENGVTKLNYTFNKAGKPKVEAKFNGDNTYLASNATNTTTVSKIPTITTVKTDEDTITVTLTDENGKLLANKKVTVTINGKTYTKTTDFNGQAIIDYPNAWDYEVTATFAGDDNYFGSKATAPKRTPTIITLDVDGDEITATLTDENANPIAGKEITFRVKGVVIGFGITNAEGKATIYYKDAYKYKISASFAGDENYAPSSAEYTPKSSNNLAEPNSTAGTATMKETGIPIIAILLTLIASLGLAVRKRD